MLVRCLAITTLLLHLTTQVVAWGAIGHEIVATIAQTQLHPDVRRHLCEILPVERTQYRSFYPHSGLHDQAAELHCHLAPLSAWADRVHKYMPWASHLHYVDPENDNPPKHCEFGEHGWQDHGSGNVLLALQNYTDRLMTTTGYQRDVALRFLTHFMGDMHQPLHLTGRARGGNEISVRFNGRYAKLHSVWDSLLLNDEIRDLANYTTPLHSPRIESALLGKPYDAYIRWILAEGLGQGRGAQHVEEAWWRDEVDRWTECPDLTTQHSTKKSNTHWLRSLTPHSSRLAQRIYGTIYKSVASEREVEDPRPYNVNVDEKPVCPLAWAKPMHELACSYAFAHPVPADPSNHSQPLVELNTEEYAGRVHNDKVIHRQLARAGIRLAAVLNTLLLPEVQGSAHHVDPVSHTRLSYVRKMDSNSKKDHPKHGGHHNKKGSSPIVGLVKVTVSSIAEVIVLSSMGYLMARRGILDKRTQTKINKVNISLFTPSLLFSKVAFSLNAARLAELVIVPAGFTIIVVTSALAAMFLSWITRLSRSQRNFAIACAITPNSNSLPVALMQSLVVTVPQLHWEEDGEPEDTVNGMLGRALTYLVLFSTLGIFLRWSIASQLLSTMEETEDKLDVEPAIGVPTGEPRTGQLIEHEDDVQTTTPQVNVRRATADGGGQEIIAKSHRKHSARQAGWTRSFPNSPHDSREGSSGQQSPNDGTMTPRWQDGEESSVWETLVVKPFEAVRNFMTMPLYAALFSLIVACVPPLQKGIASIQPLVGALETAGACSIPLTMVVLGAYFYEEAEPPTNHAEEGANAYGERSNEPTLVNEPQHIRKPIPYTKPNGESVDSSNRQSIAEEDEEATETSDSSPLIQGTALAAKAADKNKRRRAMEMRTVVVAVASRMIVTPLILIPPLAWYAIATRYNVVDDPVFITCACLVIGSPPALTLAQITSQSAKGSNSSFERLISKTIFVGYAILATPTTICLVLAALLIAENDH